MLLDDLQPRDLALTDAQSTSGPSRRRPIGVSVIRRSSSMSLPNDQSVPERVEVAPAHSDLLSVQLRTCEKPPGHTTLARYEVFHVAVMYIRRGFKAAPETLPHLIDSLESCPMRLGSSRHVEAAIEARRISMIASMSCALKAAASSLSLFRISASLTMGSPLCPSVQFRAVCQPTAAEDSRAESGKCRQALHCITRNGRLPHLNTQMLHRATSGFPMGEQ